MMIKFIPLVNPLGDVQYCTIDSLYMIVPHRDEGLIVCFKDATELHITHQESCALLDQLIKDNVYKLSIDKIMEGAI